jgi:ribosome maturation protein SDO1
LLDDALILKFKKNNNRFEIFVDKDKAYPYHCGQIKSIRDVLIAEDIFKDAKKGEKWDEKTLIDAFETSDPYKIAEHILKNGEVPLTTDQRKEKIKEKTKQILETIRREAIDPRTNAPHTMVRLENAFEQAKIHVDPFKPVDHQVEEVVKQLKFILPLKIENVDIAIRIPAQYAAQSYGIIKDYNPKKEEWGSQGDLIALVQIPAGLQNELYSKLNSVTQGNAQTKIVSKTK